MQTRFLLGPSGSGKTFCCLAEARAILRQAPAGPPLFFLVPKQATFQLERQLLADESMAGYSRLDVISFDRLAEYVLARCGQALPELLSEEGRLMVLRALLGQKRNELTLFRATARLRGFAQQLGGVIRELQRARISPEQLRALSAQPAASHQLAAKLHDLAVLLGAYLSWLGEHRLQDKDELVTLATRVLKAYQKGSNDPSMLPYPPNPAQVVSGASVSPGLEIRALWVDGFAELAPQEVEFLTALVPCCDQATFAFNLGRETSEPISWLSPWAMGTHTVQALSRRLTEQAGVEVQTEWLQRDSRCSRFAGNPVLKHLEEHWISVLPYGGAANGDLHSPEAGAVARPDAVRIAECTNPDGEATEAAREILRFVRRGGRFRETAVIVRNLNAYLDPVARVFRSFEIPFFLDRREAVGHHPLIELTRSALRTVTFSWQPDDWFGALKTGLVHSRESELDRLENEALAAGWKGSTWLEPLPTVRNPELADWLEPLRQKLVAPFQRLASELGPEPSGTILAQALGRFWERLDVADQLEAWGARPVVEGNPEVSTSIHRTLWGQMLEWLDNVALAFAHEKLSLREWLPILETGLAGQTVGVIPPTLDQVLVGSIDRSRNPDLSLAIVLGVNESVFPAAPVESNLLTSADREHLLRLGLQLTATNRQQLARERYFGYIACTRARERLVLTYALRDGQDKALNPSPFVDHILRLFPDLTVEQVTGVRPWAESEHVCELTEAGLRQEQSPPAQRMPVAIWALPPLRQIRERLGEFERCVTDQRLTPALAEALYGQTLETSVSRLEEYAACPFRFAVTSGLRAEERKLFRLDARMQGSFQHEILALFHRQLSEENKRWRDVSPAEARQRIGQIGETLLPQYENGLLQASEQSRFTARSLIGSLQDFIATVVGWMPQYDFEPHAVELAFGLDEKPLPAWEIDLGNGHRLSFRGKIDRVDIWRKPGEPQAQCVVIDYKSSARRLDPVLVAHGIQLQLLAYLNVLRSLEEPGKIFGVRQLVPAGVFFVNLRGKYASAKTRREVLDGFPAAKAIAYQHAGRFDLKVLRRLDNREHVTSGDQFNYRLKKDGQIHSACREPLETAPFKEMLDAVEGHLRRMGQEIYAGRVDPDPYRRGNATACEHCEYQSICRIDPWTHPFRVLQ